MEENTKTTESVRVSIEAIEIAKEVKRVTQVPIIAFINKAIRNEAKRLPKAVKERMSQDIINSL